MRSHGMSERITVWVGKDWDGFTFRLRPETKRLVKDLQPKTKSFAGGKKPELPMSQVSISFDEKKTYEELERSVYTYILEMLTGLSEEEIEKLGGAIFRDAKTEEIIYDTKGEK